MRTRPGRTLAVLFALSAPLGGTVFAQGGGPWSRLAATAGEAPLVIPPRALSVIPERHLGRRLRIRDQLDRVEPVFPDHTPSEITGDEAILVFLRRSRVPVFVRKTESSIATLLQVPTGASVIVEGLLVREGPRYLILSDHLQLAGVRP